LIPGSGRSPGGGNGNPLQYSCLENPMDRGAWWATVHRIPKSWTQLSDSSFPFLKCCLPLTCMRFQIGILMLTNSSFPAPITPIIE